MKQIPVIVILLFAAFALSGQAGSSDRVQQGPGFITRTGMLELRRGVDAGKVGIAGHGQGGWIAPPAAPVPAMSLYRAGLLRAVPEVRSRDKGWKNFVVVKFITCASAGNCGCNR